MLGRLGNYSDLDHEAAVHGNQDRIRLKLDNQPCQLPGVRKA
jgi:hypothetical protein